MAISFYRDGKFLTRSVGLSPAEARSDLERHAAGKTTWPAGSYEARLLGGGRVLKIVRWSSEGAPAPAVSE